MIEVFESLGDAAEVSESAVDGFDGSFGCTDIKVGQHMFASMPQGCMETHQKTRSDIKPGDDTR